MVAAPAADSVFTNFGATGCFFGVVVVVVVVVVVETPVPDARATVVVVVVVDEAVLIGLPANVNSTFVDWLAYVSSAARVIVTMHVPAVDAVNTPLVMVQPAPPGEDTE